MLRHTLIYNNSEVLVSCLHTFSLLPSSFILSTNFTNLNIFLYCFIRSPLFYFSSSSVLFCPLSLSLCMLYLPFSHSYHCVVWCQSSNEVLLHLQLGTDAHTHVDIWGFVCVCVMHWHVNISSKMKASCPLELMSSHDPSLFLYSVPISSWLTCHTCHHQASEFIILWL